MQKLKAEFGDDFSDRDSLKLATFLSEALRDKTLEQQQKILHDLFVLHQFDKLSWDDLEKIIQQ